MSLNAATIAVLIAKGLSAEDLLEVAKATEAKADRTNAERQARHRERKRNAVTVTGDAPPKERNQTPQPSEPEGSSGNKRAKKSTLVLQVPDWVPPDAWCAFVAMRKAMRNVPFTDDAAKGIIGDLDRLQAQGHDPEKLLMKAVKRGWRGVFEADDTKVTGTLSRTRYEPKTPDELRRAIAAGETHGWDVSDLRKRLEETSACDPPERRGRVVSIGAAAASAGRG